METRTEVNRPLEDNELDIVSGGLTLGFVLGCLNKVRKAIGYAANDALAGSTAGQP